MKVPQQKLNQAMSTKAKTETITKVQGTFIRLNEDRILKNGIKKYLPNKNASINIYFNLSLAKPEVRTYNFGTIKHQQEVLAYLDSIYL